MKVLREVIDYLNTKKEKLETEMSFWQEQREIARAAGDLSENQDYETAQKKLSEIYNDYSNITNITSNAELVDVTDNFNLIDIGCRFRLNMRFPGKVVESDLTDNTGNTIIHYDTTTNTTILNIICVFGGPTDEYLDRMILSSTSPFAKKILGTPVGEFQYLTTRGVRVDVSTSKIS